MGPSPEPRPYSGPVRRALLILLLAALALPTCAMAQVQPAPADPFPSPVARGDWPDPDITEIDGAYYAVATSGGWAPTFRILRSADLRSWKVAGSVFRRAPRWAKDSFWAPEMAALPGGGYALFYSAYPRKRPGRPWYCLGVATAATPLGPWRDLGKPLRCGRHGAIDATPVLDGTRLHLIFKEDGNAFGEPTPLLIQRLRTDGRRLLGKPRELLRNRPRSWERRVVEAPFLVQRDGWWHMLYSGNLCCSRSCAYAVGSARARTLAGPWRRNPANPILRSGNGWRCPGHASVVGDWVAFHAYRTGAFLAGRQMHVAALSFTPDGWPAIGDGRPLAPADGAEPTAFDDTFAGASFEAEWEWPVTRVPKAVVAHGLTLSAPRKAGKRLDGGVLARRLGSHRYTATAQVELSGATPGHAAGLAVIRGGPFQVGGQAIGVYARRGEVGVWRRGGGRYKVTPRGSAPAITPLFLRVVADGRRYAFSYSADGELWTHVYSTRKGPVEETARIALTAGGERGAIARFSRATLVER